MRKLIAPIANKVSWGLSNYIMRKRYDVACIEAKKKLQKVLPRVAAAFEAQRAQGGFSHQFSELKLLELAEYLWRFRPKTILELGGGGTTAVLAEYAASESGVQVVSVDESQYYLDATRERLNIELRDKITFVQCSRNEETDLDGLRTCFYDDAWKIMFHASAVDLVYVDGPTTDDGSGGKLPCTDVVRLCDDGWVVGHVLFDVRIASVKYCVTSGRFDTHNFHLHRNALNSAKEPWVVDTVRHHSWLEPGSIRITETVQKKRVD